MKNLTVITFFAILFFMSYLTFSTPSNGFSELQNRYLHPPPKVTLQSIKDKTFIADYDKFISDHLIYVDELLKCKAKIELFIGKDRINNIYVNENMLLEDINQNSQNDTDYKISAINYFADIYKDVLQTNIMLVPTAIEIYENELPQYTTKFDQLEYINYIYSNLSNSSTNLANPQLISNSASYLYYKTDTNLTSYGSYVLYTALSKELGYKPMAVDRFNIEYASHNFLGNLHSRILYGEHLQDSISLYHYSGDNPIQDVLNYGSSGIKNNNSIFFREFINTKNQNNVFLGERDAICRVRGTNKNGKKLLIFCDETANSLMQFLPLHYEEIALVDLNSLQNTIFNEIDVFDYDQVLFLYDLNYFMNELIITLQFL